MCIIKIRLSAGQRHGKVLMGAYLMGFEIDFHMSTSESGIEVSETRMRFPCYVFSE